MILEIRNVSFSYGVINAIKDISIIIYENEFISLIGANGVGKTTLLNSIIGINRINKGNIIYNNKDISKMPTEKIVASGISIVPENRGILPKMTVFENLLLGAYCLKKNNIKNKLEYVFSYFPILQKRLNQLAGTLSGGEQQILSIARALMSSPKIIMLDEPSLGLSPIIIDEVFKSLKNLNKDGTTILLAEQNGYKALKNSNRTHVFELGKIILSGNSEELIKNKDIKKIYLGG